MPDDVLVIVGRLLMGGLFVVGGLRHFTVLDALTGVLAARKLPFPRPGLIAVTVAEIACGALLIGGIAVAWAAAGLILFVAVASVIMLDFWNQQGEMRAASISAWMANVAIVGGLLLAASTA